MPSKTSSLISTKTTSADQREFAFYYPNPIWMNGDWIKNLILFFDGIALLVPEYMTETIEQYDPAIVAGLREYDLLHIVEPEKAVDKVASTTLASTMTDIIVSGALDFLAKDSTAFHAISMSRLGYYGDDVLADKIFEELKLRGLAQNSTDGLSIPLHPMVRSLILTLLSQILRSHGKKLNAELNPVTDRPQLVKALVEMLNLPTSPSKGHVVSFDLATVGVDLAAVPIDEVLSYRKENQVSYRTYRRSVRSFAYDLSRMTEDERAFGFEERKTELDEFAADLRATARKAWKKPASFALSLVGAAWTLAKGDPLGAALSAAGAALRLENSRTKEIGAYSYLFRAQERLARGRV